MPCLALPAAMASSPGQNTKMTSECVSLHQPCAPDLFAGGQTALVGLHVLPQRRVTGPRQTLHNLDFDLAEVLVHTVGQFHGAQQRLDYLPETCFGVSCGRFKSFVDHSTFFGFFLDLQEVVWRQTDDLKEQRKVTRETRRGYGYVQGTGRQTAVEQIILQKTLQHTSKTPGFSPPPQAASHGCFFPLVSRAHSLRRPCPASSSHP